MDTAQLKVDLQRAQEACEKLSQQLIEAEQDRDKFETVLSEQKEELEVSRKARVKKATRFGCRHK